MAAPDQVPGEEFEYVVLFVCLFFPFDLVFLLVLLAQTAAGDLAIFRWRVNCWSDVQKEHSIWHQETNWKS